MAESNGAPALLASIFSGGAEQTPASSTKTETPTEEKATAPETKVDDASSPESTEGEPESTEEKETPEGKEGETKDEESEVDESLLSDEEKAAKKREADEKAAADAKEKVDKEAKEKSEAEDATFKKRFEDTAKWARDVNAQNAQLRELAANQQRQLDVLQKKVDGTWTEEDEAASKSSDTPDAVASRATLAGKAIASNAAAIREFGPEKVTAVLGEFHTLFEGNEIVKQVVSSADSPVHTAMQMVERYHFEQAYGTTPADWVKNIGQETEKKLRPVITKEIMEKIKAGKSTKDGSPSSLASAKGGKGEEGKLKEETLAPLEDIFNSNKRT